MSIRKSLVISFLDRYSGLGINILSSLVVARLLTPEEIGVFSITMVMLTFLSTMRDMGAGRYLVQEAELTTDKIRAVWTVQLFLGTILALVILGLSWPLATLYNDTRIRDIMFVVALNYVVNPVGSLTHSWLVREMQFSKSAIIRFAGAVAGAAVSIYFAWTGHGPISLAYGGLATTLVSAFMSGYFRPAHFPWMPGFKEVRRVLSFGSHLTASSFANIASSGSPELFLGKLQDLATAGYYSRANGLVQMFNRLFLDAVGAVCFPWFAQLTREKEGIGPLYLKAISYVTAIGWSFCIFIALLADPLTRILYGDQWGNSVSIARILAVAFLFNVASAMAQTVLMSLGEAKLISKITVSCAVVNITLVLFGATHDLTTLGLCLVVSSAISGAVWLTVVSRRVGLRGRNLFLVFSRSVGVALLSGAGAFLSTICYGLHPTAILAPLIVATAGAATGFLLAIILLRHPITNELSMVTAKLSARFR